MTHKEACGVFLDACFKKQFEYIYVTVARSKHDRFSILRQCEKSARQSRM